MEWTVYPYKQDKKKTILAIILIILILVFIYFTLGGLFWALLAGLLLIGSVSSYFLPTSFRVTNDGLTVKTKGRESEFEWDYFKRYHIFDDGIALSPYKEPSRLDNYRGVFLRFGDADPEKIKELVREKLPTYKSD